MTTWIRDSAHEGIRAFLTSACGPGGCPKPTPAEPPVPGEASLEDLAIKLVKVTGDVRDRIAPEDETLADRIAAQGSNLAGAVASGSTAIEGAVTALRHAKDLEDACQAITSFIAALDSANNASEDQRDTQLGLLKDLQRPVLHTFVERLRTAEPRLSDMFDDLWAPEQVGEAKKFRRAAIGIRNAVSAICQAPKA